jgi:ElaB/YqjD/DUF883 family membrane-anchored ribosome-binding protein
MARSESSSGNRRTGDDLVDRITDVGARAADTMGRVAGHVDETRDDLMEQGAQLSANVQKVGKNFSKALDKSVSEQPMTTLGLAIVTGFVLGALWKA